MTKKQRCLSNKKFYFSQITVYSIPSQSYSHFFYFPGEPEPLGIVRLMKKYSFVASLQLLCDVLPHVVRLSKLLQSKVMDVTFLLAEVKTCLDSIQSLRDNVTEGQHFSQVTAECTAIGIQVAPADEEKFFHATGLLIFDIDE